MVDQHTAAAVVLASAIVLAGCATTTRESTDRAEGRTSTGADLRFTTHHHTHWTKWHDYYHVVGWVENTGTQSAVRAEVSGTFYDENGSIVTTSSRWILRNTIPSGESSPFQLVPEDPDHRIQSYDLTVTTESAPGGVIGAGDLHARNTQVTNDDDGPHVTGEVVNQGDRTYSPVTVVAAVYEDDRLIGLDWDYTDPRSIDPGTTAGFSVDVRWAQPNATSYDVWVEG